MKYSDFPTTILTGKRENLCVRYLPCGTIAYLKTKDNEIYQAKLMGIKWISDNSYGKPLYEWKVAGHKEHFFGDSYKISLGTIYDTEYNAQHGRADGWRSEGQVLPHLRFNIRTALVEEYGRAIDNLVCVDWGVDFEYLRVDSWALLENGVIEKRRAEIELYCDQEGMHVFIPRLEDEQRYLTEEDARKAFKPKKVHTFDDDVDTKDEEKEKTITMKIEVKESDLAKIKELVKVVE